MRVTLWDVLACILYLIFFILTVAAWIYTEVGLKIFAFIGYLCVVYVVEKWLSKIVKVLNHRNER